MATASKNEIVRFSLRNKCIYSPLSASKKNDQRASIKYANRSFIANQLIYFL